MSSHQSIFSGSQTIVEHSWFEDDSVLQELLYAELDDAERELFDRVHHLAYGCAILHFLNDHPGLTATVEEIAFRLDESPRLVEKSLLGLAKLGLLRQARAGQESYSLASDPHKRQLVHDLFDWQFRWHRRLARLENLVDGPLHV